MNRLFFRPEQCGMTKTDAAAQTLSERHTCRHLPSGWLLGHTHPCCARCPQRPTSHAPHHVSLVPGGINPDVAIEAYTMNITTVDGFDAFKASVTQPGGGDASRVDLILSCVDNYEARITINQARGEPRGGVEEGAWQDGRRRL